MNKERREELKKKLDGTSYQTLTPSDIKECLERLFKVEEHIDGFWDHINYMFDMEPREELEKMAEDSWHPPNPLLVAMHYMWKRDLKTENLCEHCICRLTHSKGCRCCNEE